MNHDHVGQNWLVCVDDSVWASYAFNYATQHMDRRNDDLYILNVHEEHTNYYVGYSTAALLATMRNVEEKKSRKILVHYGQKAKTLGIKYTMMKGEDTFPASLICRTIKNYDIHYCVLGRRSMSRVQRFFVGSNSKYVVENADCNVIVVKTPVGPEEEHDEKYQIISQEEEERIRRIDEDKKLAMEDEERQKKMEMIGKMEEDERKRRIEQEGLFLGAKYDKYLSLYKFKEELRERNESKKGSV